MVSNDMSGWLALVSDLQVRVTAPFFLRAESGRSFVFDALVHDFGSSKGMVVIAQWDEAAVHVATAQGFGYSCVRMGPYNRDDMIDVLRDWGWSGPPDARPEWCTPVDDDPGE